MELKGKVALVTGGAKRVGKATALALAGRGAHVAITYQRSKTEAAHTVQELERAGTTGRAVAGDVSQPGDVERMVEEVLRAFGRIDVLVNNAAVFFKTPFGAISERDWDVTINTNLKGTFLFAQRVGSLMLKQGAGKIMNIGDWSGFRPYKDYLPYCVSKAGVIALTKGLAKTLAPTVQVNCIAPGPILLPEDMPDQERQEVIASTPLKRIGSPEDIAHTIVFLIEGSDFITGAILPVDGGRLIA